MDKSYTPRLEHKNPDTPGAILKALVNYLQIDGHQPDLFNAFKLWMTQNLDHNKYNVHCDPDWKIN